MYQHSNAVLEVEDLSMSEKAALLVLSIRANKNGKCWPSYPKIASDASMSVATAKRAVKSLIQKNLLQCDSSSGKSNHYILNLDPAHSDTTGVNNPAHGDTDPAHHDTAPSSPRHPNIPIINKEESVEENLEEEDEEDLTPEQMRRNREINKQWAIEVGLIKG